MRKHQLLSIVIPAYNEGLRIKDTFPTLLQFVNELVIDWEIIIIDDGSTDNTVDVCHSIFSDTEVKIVSNDRNRGKGYSIRRGVFLAKYKQYVDKHDGLFSYIQLPLWRLSILYYFI